MSTAADNDDVLVCANCGKEGSDNMNACNKCKQVKYCNAVCKKKHRSKHKKQCERWVAELHDEKLFKEPPQREDCPICFLRMPTLHTGSTYKSCCGKVICSGCIYAPLYDDQGNKVDNRKCPFCRTPPAYTDEEGIKRIKNRIEAGDSRAIHNLGCYYRDGVYGFRRDYDKASELYHRAGELGYAGAYTNIGASYDNGEGVEVDKENAAYYYELAAIKGNVYARHNLGVNEENEGNLDRALKHYMIAIKSGQGESLKSIQKMYKHGDASREDYMKALQLYQEYLGEIKSDQRDKAAAASERFRYY